MKQGRLGLTLFDEASQTLLKVHSMETVMCEVQTHPAGPGLVDGSSARNVGPCTLAPVTAITLCRYHGSSGVALYHRAGAPKLSHWIRIEPTETPDDSRQHF
jgi:hypothetical protein